MSQQIKPQKKCIYFLNQFFKDQKYPKVNEPQLSPHLRIKTSPKSSHVTHQSQSAINKSFDTSETTKTAPVTQKLSLSLLRVGSNVTRKSENFIRQQDSDLKILNLQLQLDVKELQSRLHQHMQRTMDQQEQIELLQQLTTHQRDTIEVQKGDEFNIGSKLWKLKSDLTQKDAVIERLNRQIKTLQNSQEPENKWNHKASKDTSFIDHSPTQEKEIKQYQLLIREQRKQLKEIKEKVKWKDYNSLLLEFEELKEKIEVSSEVNDILRQQIKKVNSARSNSPSNNQLKLMSSKKYFLPEITETQHNMEALQNQIIQLEQKEQNLDKAIKEKQIEFNLKEKHLNERIRQLEIQVANQKPLENTVQSKQSIQTLNTQIVRQRDQITQLQEKLKTLNNQQEKEVIEKLQKLDLEKKQNIEAKKKHTIEIDEREKHIQSEKIHNQKLTLEILQLQQQIDQQKQLNHIIKQSNKASLTKKQFNDQMIKIREDQPCESNGIDKTSVRLEQSSKQLINITNLQPGDNTLLSAEEEDTIIKKLPSQINLMDSSLEGSKQSKDEDEENVQIKQSSQLPPYRPSNLLGSSSDDEHVSPQKNHKEQKLLRDVDYYQKEFDELLVKYSQQEVLKTNLQRQLNLKENEVLDLQRQIDIMEKNQGSQKASSPNTQNINTKDLDRFDQFLQKQHSKMNLSQLMQASAENAYLKNDIENIEDNLDELLFNKLANIQDQLNDLIFDL